MNKASESLYNQNGRTKLNILLNALILIVVLILTAEIIFTLNYSGVYVVHSSMRPTLTGAESDDVIGGDYVYINKHAEADYGDIVVVSVDNNGFFIKRVIAFGGDTVKLVKGELYIKYKGEDEFTHVDEPYIFPEYNHPNLKKNNFHADDGGYKVPEGHFFLLGDNRNDSSDSRELGSFSLSRLDGVVTKWSVKHKSFLTALHNYFKFELPACFGIK